MLALLGDHAAYLSEINQLCHFLIHIFIFLKIQRLTVFLIFSD